MWMRQQLDELKQRPMLRRHLSHLSLDHLMVRLMG